YCHRPGPAGRAAPDLHRKAADGEAPGWQRLEIVQLLDMAVADLPAGVVALPGQACVPGRQILFPGMDEGGIPAPAVGAGDPRPALEQVEGGLAPHAAPG